MVKNSIIDQYLSAGKNLMPLDVKIPRKNWRTTIFSSEQLHSHNSNIGWQIGFKDLVVDVDPRNNGDKSWAKLCERFNLDLTPTVKTPRGGYHYYLKIPEKYNDYSFKKTLKEYEGVDFLTEGSYCLITSCSTDKGDYVWCDDLFGKFEQQETPEAIFNLIAYKLETNDLGDFEGLIGGKSANWSEDKVLEMLEKLDPSMGNDEWVKVGMALHDWDPVKGLDLWEDWSQDGDNYEEGMTETRWKSFDVSGGVTLGTISYMVKEVNYDEASEQVNRYLDKIKYANEKDLEFELIPKIKKHNFSKINLEKIVKAIQDRYKDISNVKIPISNIRNLLSGVEIINGTFVEEGEAPDWCKEWVYINSHTAFANLNTLKILKTEAFNIKNGKHVPPSVNGSKQSAAKYIADSGFIDTVDAMAYLPNTHEPVVEIDEYKVLNCFNPKTVPTAAIEYSEEGRAAISLVKKHIKFICTTKNNSDIFTQWLAHQVQFPGKQILWSPVIQSIQGVGKSFFGELLRCCLGDRNVGTVSPGQVVSDFNGWATNVSVNVLEELRVKGHNRYDAINSLKPLVTDRMIQINDKGVKQYMTYNTTNYICFTNYKDSLPIDQDDRRWWIIFTQIESLNELVEYVGESAETYFPKLFGAVRTYGNEIRKWLLEYKLSDEFLAIKQAPMTDDKLSMIATEESSFEGYSELKELIEKGGKYYNKEVVSSSDLFDALLFEYPDLDIQTSKKHLLMKKLGFSAVAKPIKIDGKARRIWRKKNYSNEKIRELLK
jgi:hypothetical protein